MLDCLADMILMLLLLAFLLLPPVTINRKTYRVKGGEAGYAMSSTYLRDRLHSGRLWQVYLRVIAYDFVQSNVCLKMTSLSNCRTQKNMIDVRADFPKLALEKHPCRSGVLRLSGGEWDGQAFFYYTYSSTHFRHSTSRICGLFHVAFTPRPYTTELNKESIFYSAQKPLTIFWNLETGKPFGINCTVSGFVAPYTHGCADATVEIRYYVARNQIWRTHRMCPNWGKRGFYGESIMVKLFMKYYREPFFGDKNEEYFTGLSFHYQILDYTNFSLGSFNPVDVAKDLTISVDVVNYKFPNPNYKTAPSVYMAEIPDALMYGFNIRAREWLTPVVLRKNIKCNVTGAQLIFYDGPAQSFFELTLPILNHWSCLNTSTDINSTDQDEVRGSIGELSVRVLMAKRQGRASRYLHIMWHTRRMLPGAFLRRHVKLELSTNQTLSLLPRERPFVDVVHVAAPGSKFVHLSFQEFQYVRPSQIYYDRKNGNCVHGLHIKDPRPEHRHVEGKLCSNFTGENLLRHNKKGGLTVGGRVMIFLTQYPWLATVSAVIIASVHSCAGYVNLLPHRNTYISENKVAMGSLSFGYTEIDPDDENLPVSFENFTVVFKRSPNACVKFQMVHFEDLTVYERVLQTRDAFLKYWITSQDLTSLSRFTVILSSLVDAVQFQTTSSSYALQTFFSEQRRAKLTPVLNTEVLDTEAYSVEIFLHSRLVTRVVGLTVQVQNGKTPPMCINEKVKDTAHILNLYLSGPCTKTVLNVQKEISVYIPKTYEHIRCCYFDGIISSNNTKHGWITMHLKSFRQRGMLLKTAWTLSGNYTTIMFQTACEKLCCMVAFLLHLDHTSFQEVSLGYRTNLIEEIYMTDTSYSRYSRHGQVCLNQACYIPSENSNVATWDEAKRYCEQKNATLGSINNDFEWRLLLRKMRYRYQIILLFIGRVMDATVSRILCVVVCVSWGLRKKVCWGGGGHKKNKFCSEG